MALMDNGRNEGRDGNGGQGADRCLKYPDVSNLPLAKQACFRTYFDAISKGDAHQIRQLFVDYIADMFAKEMVISKLLRDGSESHFSPYLKLEKGDL